jgi:hypothetical protein
MGVPSRMGQVVGMVTGYLVRRTRERSKGLRPSVIAAAKVCLIELDVMPGGGGIDRWYQPGSAGKSGQMRHIYDSFF